MRKPRHREICPRSPSHKALEQHCPIELSVMPEAFYICIAQQDSPWPHVAIEHLKCGLGDGETAFLNFI